MPKCNAQTVNVTLNILVIIGLVVCLVLAGVIMQQSHDTALLLANTKELAQELRQSSDDLTRFVRTYAVTQNYSYWNYYNQVADIRNGLLPLPVQPWRNFWDLYISDGRPPRGFTAPAALLTRVAAAHFTQTEIDFLALAKNRSDALIDIEDTAYAETIGFYRPTNTTGLNSSQALAFSVPGPANFSAAAQNLHSVAYHHFKGTIMRPIDDFAGTSNQRVLDAINYNYDINIVLISVLALMLSCLIGLLLVYFLKVARDTQTSALLSTVLPARVVDTVSVSQFNELRKVAGHRAANVNSSALVAVEGQVYETHNFPVLYSEFLPLAWVAFTDVVGFTKMCRYTPAKVVISVLNELFSLLDVEALNYGVEKIKTIGDAFMCAMLTTSEMHSAIDERTRVRNVSNDGTKIVRFLLRAILMTQNVVRPKNTTQIESIKPGEEVDIEDADHLSIRVGLHAGPVASGIVGFERPLYDLFGDTVNTAARLEASGKYGKIQLMETTMSLFDESLTHLVFDKHIQTVTLKGIGETTTRFIVGYNE